MLLTNIRIFDTQTGQMSPPQNILIEGTTISSVGITWDAPFEGREINCRGKFAVPGLFDSHIHLTDLTRFGDDSLRSALEAFVASGITQVRDVGGPIDIVSALSHRIEAGEIIGPEMFYAGPMLEKSPLTWAAINDTFPDFTVAINTTEDVDSLLPELAEQGALLIKTFGTCDTLVHKHLVDVAGRLSLRVVHDPGPPLFHWIPMDRAIEYGVTSIEHAKAPWPAVLKDDLKEEHDNLIGPNSSPESTRAFAMRAAAMGVKSVSLERLSRLVEVMKQNRVYLCPTLKVMEGMEEAALEGTRNRMAVDELEGGVRLLVGQDGHDPAGTFVEMRLMKECGVSEAEIIKGATIYPAEWLGIDDRLGSIMPGKQANILVVEANPLEDISNLEAVFMVVHKGNALSP
jgi:hypothetical protein